MLRLLTPILFCGGLTCGGLLIGGCGLPAAVSDGGAVRTVAVLSDPAIREASGLAASRRHPESYYVHNDSGHAPFVYRVDRSGMTRGTYFLAGVLNRDWEDIAMAPGADGGWDVCVADIGDNFARREVLNVYRFPEPDDFAAQTVTPQVYTFRLPAGAADAEAFAVHPQTGDGYLFTKSWIGATNVYKLPAPWDAIRTVTLTPVAELSLPAWLPTYTIVTAADIAPDGRRLALRTYAAGWEFVLPPEVSGASFDAIFSQPPRLLTLAREAQGEALAYSADGRRLLTVGEGRPAVLSERDVPADPGVPE